MRFSASSINTLSKCGYKYYLEKIKGVKEPGKRKYNMLQGDIVGDTIQAACSELVATKQLSEDRLSELLQESYIKWYTAAEIDSCVLEPVLELLRNGVSEPALLAVDAYSTAINSSPRYSFDAPPPLKGGGVSKNKKKPPLSMKVYQTMMDVMWFFSNANPVYPLVCMADTVENELGFDVAVGQPYTVIINGKAAQEQDTLSGRFDTVLTIGDKKVILEYKYAATSYTQVLVDKARQMLVYQYALRGTPGEAWLIDVAHNRAFRANQSPQLEHIVETLVLAARGLVSNAIFMPKCGSDPYTDNSVLCGFKGCGECPFSTGEITDDD